MVDTLRAYSDTSGNGSHFSIHRWLLANTHSSPWPGNEATEEQ